MTQPRWRIADLLTLVLFAGIAMGGYRAFWNPTHPNARLLLSSNLSMLTTATLCARFAHPRWRRFWLGYACFGWVNLVSVLKGGFGLVTYSDAESIAEGSLMGMVFGVLCGIAALWFLTAPQDPKAPD